MAEGMFGQVRSTSSSDASNGIESFTQKNSTPCRRKASAYAGIIFQSCSSRQRQRMVILERQLKILPTSVVRRSAGGARYLLRLLRGDNFLKDRVQVVRNFPVRIVRLKFALSATFTRYERNPCSSTPECDGPVRHPPRKIQVFMPK